MDMADYWLTDKSLVPKLFQELVPRYQSRYGPYTQVHKLPVQYPGSGKKRVVMELVDNPLPKIKPAGASSVDFSNSITNILLRAYKQNYHKFNSSKAKSADNPSATTTTETK